MRNRDTKKEVLDVLMTLFDKAERFDRVAYYLDKNDIDKAKEIIHGTDNGNTDE